MDNAMIKRGIGAIVLAIIAALLLGYLLKDKSRERQEVIEMKLPGAPEMRIPSLMGSDDSIDTDTSATLVNEASTNNSTEISTKIDNVNNSKSSMTTSASNVFSSFKNTVSVKAKEAIESTKDVFSTEPVDNPAQAKPGFAIRPSSTNEQRETVDTFSGNNSDNQTTNIISAIQSASPTRNNTVVASTKIASVKKPVKKYKPRIIKEKKKTVAKKSSVVIKKSTPVIATSVSSAAKGTYSIQLLATSSQSRAEKLANTMRSEGYTAFITQASSNNKVIFRVRVGAHNERNTAIEAQASLKRRYQKNFFVQNSLVISNK